MFNGLTIAIHPSSRHGDPAGQDRLLELLLLNGATVNPLNLAANINVVLVDIARCHDLLAPPNTLVLDYTWAELSARAHRRLDYHDFQPMMWGDPGNNFFSQEEFLFVMPSVPRYGVLVKNLKLAGARVCFEPTQANVILVNIETDYPTESVKPETYVVDYTWAELSIRCRYYFSIVPFLVPEPASIRRITAPHRMQLRDASEPLSDEDELHDENEIPTPLFSGLEKANPLYDGSAGRATVNHDHIHLQTPPWDPSTRPEPEQNVRFDDAPNRSGFCTPTPEQRLGHNSAQSQRELHPPPAPVRGARRTQDFHEFIQRLMEWQLVRSPSASIYSVSRRVDDLQIFSPKRRVFQSYWRFRKALLETIRQRAADMRRRGFRAVGKMDDIIKAREESLKKSNPVERVKVEVE